MAIDRLTGWDEIAAYIKVHPRTAERYEETRGLPVHRLPWGGTKSPVFAFRTELDAWIETNIPASQRKTIHAGESNLTSTSAISQPVIDRIRNLTNLTLFRRDYRLRFVLRKSPEGVRCRVECRYEVCNPTDERQPFVQEVTVDVSDHGHVEEMSFLTDEKPVYVLQRPRAMDKFLGYSSYRGWELLIEPDSRGRKYECRAIWMINRAEDDFWPMHMLLPTLGVTVETYAPADFDIRPSFSTTELVMKAEHFDIAWRRRIK